MNWIYKYNKFNFLFQALKEWHDGVYCFQLDQQSVQMSFLLSFVKNLWGFYESFMCCIIEKEFTVSWWWFGPKITSMDIEDKIFKMLTLLTAVCWAIPHQTLNNSHTAAFCISMLVSACVRQSSIVKKPQHNNMLWKLRHKWHIEIRKFAFLDFGNINK
jgi:hypothetical protein